MSSTVLVPRATADTPTIPDTASVGNPLAPKLVPLIVQEMRDGFRQRGVERQFAQWCSYARSRLDATAGDARVSEITGNCRLSWFDRMLRNPYLYPAEAELFTRQLHEALRGDYRGFDAALRIARSKMDLGTREIRPMTQPTTPEEAIEIVKQALIGAQAGFATAAGSIPRSELDDLRENLYPVMTSQNREGHTLVDRPAGRRLSDIMEKMDRTGFYRAAESLVPLLSDEVLKQLAAIPDKDSGERVPGVTGPIAKKIVTPAGTIVIGGKGRNTYDLDKMRDVAVVIDLGGDDVYQEGTTSAQRPVLIVIDLAGNDRYEATRPGVQGGALVGVSMLIDVSGNDVYRAGDVAQGSALCGVGILVDMAGNDQYIGVRRVQGHALGGLGILLDRAGNDRYHAAMWAQGFGAPMGFGVLDDLDGKDRYYCGGLYRNSYYPETPGYEGWGQGMGAGIRQVACGGIGAILDGGGDDVYEYDYLSHGGGYWLGMGFARDFGGNDRRFGGTQKEYYGGERTQEMFQRFGCGFGCHFALGCLIDDSGNDTYGGTIMGLGMGWDMAVGLLCDFGGNDHYNASGGLTQGNGAQASIGILFDYGGDDVYEGYNQGYASSGISYHPPSQCGGNFSLLIDYGGNDTYGCEAENNTYNERGADTGFLIDRPLPSEAAKAKAAKKAAGDKENAEADEPPVHHGGGLTDRQAEALNRAAIPRAAQPEKRSQWNRLWGSGRTD